jgi:hypothetical protein
MGMSGLPCTKFVGKDDKKDDTWEPITHLLGHATMVKVFKESHAKDLEKLAADRREVGQKATHNYDLANTPQALDQLEEWSLSPSHYFLSDLMENATSKSLLGY